MICKDADSSSGWLDYAIECEAILKTLDPFDTHTRERMAREREYALNQALKLEAQGR